MISTSRLVYPPEYDCEQFLGLYPIDFLLEDLIEGGIEWFRNNADAPKQVFGQLQAKWLSTKYGENKINEIANFIKKYKIRVVQHYSLIDEENPSISIQLQQAEEDEHRASMDDFLKNVDVQNEVNGAVVGRDTLGYIPITDHIQIGIHTISTPDLTKYLYYLVIYLLNVFKMQLQERGLLLTTFRATDISRVDEKLPENFYSRYINFSTYTVAPFMKHKAPILEDIILRVKVDDTTVISDGG